jgi:hypothetical protein
MLSLNSKNVQHVKIYLPCNFEVNPIIHFGVIALFSYPLGGGSKMGNRIYLKIAGYVDLDMVHIFAI